MHTESSTSCKSVKNKEYCSSLKKKVGYSSAGELQDGWDEFANSSMRKNGCLGDVLGQDH